MILVQRVVRHKGSKVAVLSGKVLEVADLVALRNMTKTRKQVFAYLTSDSKEGIMRSGRKMRPVDLHVRNVLQTMQVAEF